MADTWVQCEDVLVAVDDLLCNSLSRRCSVCGLRATHETIVGTVIAGRVVGVACSLCPACFRANDPRPLVDALRRRYADYA